MQPNGAMIDFRGTVYENGYGQVSQQVMRDKSIHAVAKAFYAYLCAYAGSNIKDDREAFPSVKTIMEDLGIKSEDTFLKYRKQLIDAGYLDIEQQKSQDGKFNRNIYVIRLIKRNDQPSPKKSSTENRPLKNRAPKKTGHGEIGVNNKQSFKNNHLRDKNKHIYISSVPDYEKDRKDQTIQLSTEDLAEAERLLRELGEIGTSP